MAKIEITENGPYIVEGKIKLNREVMSADEKGIPYEWNETEVFDEEETYYLCRCGHSKNKPFCDDSHLTAGFDGTETSKRKSFKQMARTFTGPDLVMKNVRNYCASARFCARSIGIRLLTMSSDDPELKAIAIQEAADCPSGSIVVYDKETLKPIEPNFDPCITVAEDPGRRVSGPLVCKGDVELISSDGHVYEKRNRMALCRCGQSNNKPFCDGSHIRAGFKDGDESIQ